MTVTGGTGPSRLHCRKDPTDTAKTGTIATPVFAQPGVGPRRHEQRGAQIQIDFFIRGPELGG